MSTAAVQKPKDLFLLEGINILSFNKDFTEVALSKKDNNIYIYSVENLMKTDTWKLKHTLKSHYQYISGLDWCPETNRILSCSYDKTSFVWDYANEKWTPSNVVVTTKLGYLCCKWNKRGDKFCEGTSAKQLYIGYYNDETKWWMGVNIKVHKSSVVTCEIDPTSLFVISGSTDLRIFVSSCYLPQIDDKYITEDMKPLAQPFGDTIYEFKENSWINSVTWLPNGYWGLAASQDAVISVVNLGEKKVEQIKCKHSPVTMIIPKDDNGFYAVCYDRNIVEYERKGDNWEIKKTITGKKEGDNKAKTTIGNVSAQLAKFQKMGLQNKQNLAVSTKQASHLHKSQISSINIIGKDVITTDLSGFVKYWKL
jgi:actin related protein 2/3 complex subunit 1A/1B